ncbi:MAG: hypothetical protein ACPLY9_02060 [Nitrososphaerales archaeon]
MSKMSWRDKLRLIREKGRERSERVKSVFAKGRQGLEYGRSGAEKFQKIIQRFQKKGVRASDIDDGITTRVRESQQASINRTLSQDRSNQIRENKRRSIRG